MNDLPTAVTGATPSATVLIADDHALLRDGIRMLVQNLLGNVRCLEADDAASTVRMLKSHPEIDVALVDLSMPGAERGAQVADIARYFPRVPLVVISALTSPDVVRRTLNIETVHAFVPKSATSAQMREAIEAALEGRKLPFQQAAPVPRRVDSGLTPRMEEVRELLRQGMSNKLIANTLGISEGTVKNYMSEIFKALNVSNRTQAARPEYDML